MSSRRSRSRRPSSGPTGSALLEYKDRQRQGHVVRYLIWMQGPEVLSWWDIKPGVAKEDSIEFALARATGVSGGSAHAVPSLLLTDRKLGALPTDLQNPKRVGDDKQDGVDCFRVEGQFGKATRTLWIDKGASLLRRIDDVTKTADFQFVSTTIYEPSAGGEIAADLLDFDPPK